jgi:hypothetical protein
MDVINTMFETKRMTVQEKQWFEALTKDRLDSASMLEKPSMRGVQRSVVDKYSDQAHFIYELLQNADDVKATWARFRLEKDGLYFVHNGSVRFTVTDPSNEDRDSGDGVLGHINAITSIANSSKTEASIGKFGVGFKAVFQYTRTPHIYDPAIQFRIERFIVPKLLDSDLGWRKSSETVFFFPYDHKDKSPQDCHTEIIEKLKSLEFPVLFLSNLKSVSFESDEISGKYTKEVTREFSQEDIKVQNLTLALTVDRDRTEQHLMIFTRNTATGNNYSIGYSLGENKNLLAIERSAFCFFPTKEVTNLSFIIHAPFLLTDSREGIKAGEKYNLELIQQLAELAADSLVTLRDEQLLNDDILEIIPYDETKFSQLEDRSRISFKPFYISIKNKLQTASLLPALNGSCSQKSNSYWASDTELVELISDKQLAELTGTVGAQWVFRSRGKKEVQNTNKALAHYIDGGDARTWGRKEPNLIVASLDPENLLKKISKKFIAAQSERWLHELYKYLTERVSYQNLVKEKPIFFDQDANAVSAYDDKKQLILFLPDNDIDGYTTVKQELLMNEASCEFIKAFGIKKPSLRDEIYNKILPAYESSKALDTAPHFTKFFRYFNECKNEEVAEFIELIKDKKFLRYATDKDSQAYRGKASEIYLPTPDLKAWFKNKPDTKFLLLDEYAEMVGKDNLEKLNTFLRALKLSSFPRISSVELDDTERQKLGLEIKGNHVDKFTDKVIDGLDELLSNIDHSTAPAIWRILASHESLEREINGIHEYHIRHYRHNTIENFYSSTIRCLHSNQWILNQAGHLVSANEVTVQTLSNQYDKTSVGSEKLIRFLKIRDETHDSSHLTDEEARKVKLADEIERSGLSVDEIRAAIEDAKLKKIVHEPTGNSDGGNKFTWPNLSVMQDIEQRRSSIKNGTVSGKFVDSSEENSARINDRGDVDDYIPKVVDFGRIIERAKNRYASEIDRLENEQALHHKASTLQRYSYGWFLALLELECMASSAKNLDGKTISICFGKVVLDEQSSRTIILSEPSGFIPQSIEELSGVRLDLDFGNGVAGKLHVESFTAKEFTLHAKLETADELKLVELSEVMEARIEIHNPSFLLRELLERFREFKFAENFDMKAALTSEIEFVFGPPGTGKTTHLADKVLIPRMIGNDKQRIIVLTPTNKAADVLTTRIIDCMGDNTSYVNWLVRFGTSADERIESAGVWRDRSFDIRALDRSITVTTIARFAYDGFSGENGCKLYDLDWDVIVIDEASMISLASIIYPLYRQKPNKFIIAGDPFQIEPIVSVEQWRDENIYTLVGLNKVGSFSRPHTEPHDYLITNLETQYRSIPAIGELFSRFTYNGVLKHHRDSKSQRQLSFKGFNLKPINLIKFPVSKYESIYRPKRLESGTPYQTYSALFTFEFVRWLADQIETNSTGTARIGIIAPYRAQASLLSRLNDSWIKKPDVVDVQVGTIHGFQGDECDIIISVFNPPPTISKDSRMFLNKQNILNVAISRARDYLFIVMPDSQTENVENLHMINEIEKLTMQGGEFSDYLTHEIEEIIWGNQKHLEDNTFSTGHQMVNVYRKPEYYYEVRSDESAIDVQIHERIGD